MNKPPRVVVVGCGQASDLKGADYLRLGGIAIGKVPAAAGDAMILAELPGGAMKPDHAADVAPAVAEPRHNLPARVSSFVGRERELGAIAKPAAVAAAPAKSTRKKAKKD